MSDGENIYDPAALLRELAGVRRDIRHVTLVVNGRGVYRKPVPDVRRLQRREAELVVRLEALGTGAGQE